MSGLACCSYQVLTWSKPPPYTPTTVRLTASIYQEVAVRDANEFNWSVHASSKQAHASAQQSHASVVLARARPNEIFNNY